MVKSHSGWQVSNSKVSASELYMMVVYADIQEIRLFFRLPYVALYNKYYVYLRVLRIVN